ncbi:hypothetical protein [Saccharothrix luteola]|jgi:hypothetical protein|uniref:hypothetical protein n=1 Tax=Saccharothrix luteola TaxID=2893018 RepID=UPI001E45D1D3|nr:hypothetical protein [Saccharothrix luteola]MCC8250374.1 hypothetical protein [Saccharothrix luteola]
MRRLVEMAGLVLAGLVLAGCAQQPVDTGSFGTEPTTTPVGVSSLPVPPPKLSPQAKTALEQARREGARTVGLTVSTEPGKADEVAAAADRLGGTVETTDATIGYVRLTVPVDLAEEVTSLEGVSRVDVDEPLSNIDPTP